jgi:site-specific DNA-methyltransferase (adenine-specific)
MKGFDLSKLRINPSNPFPFSGSDTEWNDFKKKLDRDPEFLEANKIAYDSSRDNLVIAGNKRVQGLRELGWKTIPAKYVINCKDWSEEKRERYIYASNWNIGQWSVEFTDEEQADEWGITFEEEEEIHLEAKEDEYVPPAEIQTDIVKGDLFELRKGDLCHRLLCGDSTDSDAVSKLMGGSKARMAFTSPPYNAGKSEKLSGNTHTSDNKYNKYHDNQTQQNYLNLLIEFTNNALINADYLICNLQSLSGNKIALIEYLHKYKTNFIDVAIWDKGNGAPAMAENVMTSVWEYIFFISSKENATRAIPNAGFRGTIQNIYRGKPNTNNEFSEFHAAVFPIDLPVWAIQFSKVGDIVLDQFLGTATTMVAAHQLERNCYGMELDEKYCQIGIDRMLKLDEDIQLFRNGEDVTEKYRKRLENLEKAS